MAEKTITVIPARKRVGSRKQVTEEKPKLRVAAYCRVSTDRDEQESSYEAQVEHYTEFIDRNPEWQLAGIYADDGISGTNTKKREEFNRMIEDCMAYALSSIVYCAHCNDIFRRINWNNRGCKSTVWRCLSRVEKDRPSCTARTVKEELLHEVVVRAVNEVITGSASIIPALQASFERCLGDSNSAAVEEIDARLLELQQELLKLANAKQNYDALADEIDELRAEKEELLLQEANKDGIRQRMADMVAFLQSEPEEVTEYSEALVRRMIEKISVYDDHFVVEFKSGIEITINE